jgi:hypothetical protein
MFLWPTNRPRIISAAITLKVTFVAIPNKITIGESAKTTNKGKTVSSGYEKPSPTAPYCNFKSGTFDENQQRERLTFSLWTAALPQVNNEDRPSLRSVDCFCLTTACKNKDVRYSKNSIFHRGRRGSATDA